MNRRSFATAAAVLTLVTAAGCGVSEDAPKQQQGTRVIHHAMGQTRVSAHPKRVVVLDTGELDQVLALGVRPVGSVRPDDNATLPSYLADKTGNVTEVGTISTPDLERIATLRPDLILSSKVRHADQYDALSKIAPTVFTETTGAPWKENFLLNAEALNKRPQAQQVLRRYEDKADSLGRVIGDPARLQASTLRFISGGKEIRLYSDHSFIGTVLADVGLSRPRNQLLDKTFASISREQVGQADGDLLFASGYGATSLTALDELMTSAQWRNLRATREGKAFKVNDDYWFLGLGPLAANLVLDDLRQYLSPR